MTVVPTARVICVLSVDPDQPTLGAGPAPLLRLLDETGQVAAQFIPGGLSQERALIGIEVYRRGEQWKVRAVGQGYAGGLAELVRAHGVDVDDEPAASRAPAASATSVTGPSPDARPNAVQQNTLPVNQPTTAAPATEQWESDAREQENLIRVCRAIMEDASRSTAGFQSTRRHAEGVLHRALEQLLDDPRMRVGAAADQARHQAQLAHDQLIEQAKASHRRDVDQLAGELADWERRAPAGLARWDSPAWASWRPHEVVAGIRVGHLSLPDAPQIEVPFVIAAGHRPIWIDPEVGGPAAAAHLLRVLMARLLAGYGTRAAVDVIDPAGVPLPLSPLGAAGCQVQLSPAAVSLDTAKQTLRELLQYQDRVSMAAQAGLLDELEFKIRLLVLTDFPTGFDDEALAMLHRLVDEGPLVQVVFVGSDTIGIDTTPLVQEIFRVSSRVPAGPGGSLTDGFGQVDWDFVPDPGPADPVVLESVLGRVSRGE